MTDLALHVGDVVDGCPLIADNSVDLSICSPPYFSKDGYSDDLMVALGRVWARTLKPGGRAYLNFAQIKEKLDRPLNAQRAVMRGAAGALAPGQEIIWVKSIAVGGWEETCPAAGCGQKFEVETLSRGHFQPINSEQLLNYCWEHIFCFIKKPVSESLPLARRSVGVQFTDKSNLTRGNRGQHGDLHCGGDIWWMPYETTGPTLKKEHRHGFPLELPKRVIKLSGIPKGSLVMDPFMGGGTSAIAARELGMRACGYDKSEFIVDAVKKDWEGSVDGYKSP